LEEIAKIRAARRLWAKIMRERFGAKTDRACLLRTHAQTSGVSLTAQQPVNNVVRVAIQALAGVLAGVQSLHTNSMDETLALPTEEAVTVALRTQQIIAEETGVVNTTDPFGGSYAIEALTTRMEQEAKAYIDRIDEMGGMLRAIEIGYPQKEIADAAFAFQMATDAAEYVTVGVNGYLKEDDEPLEVLKIGLQLEEDVKREVAGAQARARRRQSRQRPGGRRPRGTRGHKSNARDSRSRARRLLRWRNLRRLPQRVRGLRRPRLALMVRQR
jgi:methylmalonyl-CoA mutase N-terminal domain/subunit